MVKANALPPGPSGRLRPTLKFLRDPRGTMEQWRDRYGDPFYVHALNGPVVITGRSDLIQQVFSHDPSDFEVFARQSAEPILGAGSMLLLTGDAHRRERKLIMPMFHGQRMRAYAGTMAGATHHAFESRVGRVFNTIDATTEISLAVIVDAIFGSESPETSAHLFDLARRSVDAVAPILFFTPRAHVPFFGLSPWDRLQQASNELRSALRSEIDRRRSSGESGDDILSLLLNAQYEDGESMDEGHMFDELGTFLFAGHETTAVALCWAIYHLLKHPDVLTTLSDEVEQCDQSDPAALSKLPYLNGVVQETLRLHPVVTDVLRVTRSPMSLGGYELPAGTGIAPAIVLAHHNADVFPNSNAFQPERFVNRTYSSSEFLPFGGGQRRCAGAAFATYEMAIALGTIVRSFDLELLEKKPVRPKRRNVTMGPSTGISIRCARRS